VGRSGGRTVGPDPGTAQFRESVTDVVAFRTAGVVDPKRRLAAGEGDFAHRDTDAARTLEVDLGRVGVDAAVGRAVGRLDGRTVGRVGRTIDYRSQVRGSGRHLLRLPPPV